MPKTNYYLKANAIGDGSRLIYLFFSYDGLRLKYSTGQTIKETLWNSEEQHARKTFNGYETLNRFLKDLGNHVENAHRESKSKGIVPTPKYLKGELDSFMQKFKILKFKEEPIGLTFEQAFNQYIEVRSIPGKHKLSDRSIEKLTILLKKLKGFSKQYRIPLSFDEINENFYHKFLTYEAKNGLANTSVHKEIVCLKTFLTWAYGKGYTDNNKHMITFKGLNNSTKVLSLTNDELFELYNYDFSPDRNWTEILKGMTGTVKERKNGQQISTNGQIVYSKSWELIRDIFCFCAFTSLRYSDYEQLARHHINQRGNYIDMNLFKTAQDVLIPLNKFSLAILEKYDFQFPKLTDGYINRELKHICRVVGFTDKIEKIKFVGEKRISEVFEKWEKVSLHIARKSFVTLSLARGMRAETVMKATGHRSHATMKPYIHVANSMLNTEMTDAWENEAMPGKVKSPLVGKVTVI